jgi:hypothetical protein
MLRMSSTATEFWLDVGLLGLLPVTSSAVTISLVAMSDDAWNGSGVVLSFSSVAGWSENAVSGRGVVKTSIAMSER